MRLLKQTAILAAFLASPLMAADRPVGPETGELRGSGNQTDHRDPDDSEFASGSSDAIFAGGFSSGDEELSHHDADGTLRCVYRWGWRFCY